MKEINFAYHTFLIAASTIVLLMFAALVEDDDNSIEETYEIICQHPKGHIVSYHVSKANILRPSNFKGGIWSFKNINGKLIRSTFCHVELQSKVEE